MRHFRTIGTPTMSDQNATAWAALVSGAAGLAKNPLPEDGIPCLWPRWGCKHGYGESCRNCDPDENDRW
jgi:hypothetical protein